MSPASAPHRLLKKSGWCVAKKAANHGAPAPAHPPPIQAAKNVPSVKEGMLARDVEAPEEQPVASADKPVSSDLRPSNPVHTIQVGPDMAAAADKLHKIN